MERVAETSARQQMRESEGAAATGGEAVQVLPSDPGSATG
jgi:hypothetical protein